jgi:hypothetical protein
MRKRMTDQQRARPYLGEPAEEFIRTLDDRDADILKTELRHLPLIEAAAASVTSVPNTKDEYRAIVLPSGYLVVYRKFRVGEAPAGVDPQDGYLIADIQPMTAQDTPSGLRHLFK